MNASTVADVLLIVAAVVWVLARQVQVARVAAAGAGPLVLAFFGIRGLPASTWRMPADLALLAVSAALSLGLGAWHDSMRLEHRIDIAGDAGSVVSQGHSGAAHDEYVCHHAPANEALTQRGECLFKFRPAEEDTVGIAHAASRSLAV